MTKKIIIATLATIALGSSVIAKPNMEQNPEGVKKLSTMAGEMGAYYRAKEESFPKDYFLVSQNLPFLVGATLFHPQSDTLNLSEEQLKTLTTMKNTIVPISAKLAKEVKVMELELAKKIVKEGKSPESLSDLVDKISQIKVTMTKAHLKCIYDVQKVLSKEQFETLIKLVSNKQ